METKQILISLDKISTPPVFGTEEYDKWLKQEEFLQFLLNTRSDEVLLYSSYKYVFIYSVIVPEKYIKDDYVVDLMKWQLSACDSWGYGYSHSKYGKNTPHVYSPFSSNYSKIVEKAQPVTYLRSFEGRINRKSYVEVSQFLTHIHDLHFMEERQAYCTLNSDGDIEEIIKIFYPQEGGYLATIKQETLDFHLFLNKSVLIRFFDKSIFDKEADFNPQDRNKSDISDKLNEIYANRTIIRNTKNLHSSSYIRGFQIIRNTKPTKYLMSKLTRENLEPKKYEVFITQDFKHKKIDQVSCDPSKLDSYFVDTDRPFQTSPVFFKPDVLLKYKQDPEKYTLDQRYISCRNSWSLQTYDINDAGQVFTYICYLGDLPYNEQLHWKQYNETPKAGISQRAFKTDFEAEWDLEYEPLSELQSSLESLSNPKGDIWRCIDNGLNSQLHYVVSTSVKEWADEIQTLDKLVVEGFNYSSLKRIGQALNIVDSKLGSIRLLGEILKAKGINTQEVEQIISPLVEIQYLRTKFSAHLSEPNEKDHIRKKLISKHGSLKDHFHDLIERTDKSFKSLSKLISDGTLSE